MRETKAKTVSLVNSVGRHNKRIERKLLIDGEVYYPGNYYTDKYYTNANVLSYARKRGLPHIKKGNACYYNERQYKEFYEDWTDKRSREHTLKKRLKKRSLRTNENG